MDYYDVLGVARGATEAEIKKAYRALVKEVHPDSGTPGDVDRFRALQTAYETLSHPERRRGYDAAPTTAPVSWTGGFEEPLVPFREVRPRRAAPPAQVDIVMSLEEAFRGGEIALEVPRERECPSCSGRGLDFYGWCHPCGGNGAVRCYERVVFRVPPGTGHGAVISAPTSQGRSIRAQVRIRR